MNKNKAGDTHIVGRRRTGQGRGGGAELEKHKDNEDALGEPTLVQVLK